MLTLSHFVIGIISFHVVLGIIEVVLLVQRCRIERISALRFASRMREPHDSLPPAPLSAEEEARRQAYRASLLAHGWVEESRGVFTRRPIHDQLVLQGGAS